MNTTEHLQFIVQNDLHLVDVTGTRRRFIAVRREDGSMPPLAPGRTLVREIPEEMLADLLRQSYVEEAGTDDNGDRGYRPTTDGQLVGHSVRSALRMITEYVVLNCDGFVTSGLQQPTPGERQQIKEMSRASGWTSNGPHSCGRGSPTPRRRNGLPSCEGSGWHHRHIWWKRWRMRHDGRSARRAPEPTTWEWGQHLTRRR
jgi:hypothetical protein